MIRDALSKVAETLPPTVHRTGYAAAAAVDSTCEAYTAIEQWRNELASYDPYGDDKDGYGGNYSSFMGGGKARFHPGADFFYLETARNEVAWLAKKFQFTGTLPESVTTPEEWKEVHACLNAVFDLVGATGVSHYVKTTNRVEAARVFKNAAEKAQKNQRKTRGRAVAGTPEAKAQKLPNADRKTCRGELVLSGSSVNATRKSTSFKHHGDYTRALKFASELAGRVYMWSDSWVTAHALRLAKVGLVDAMLDTYAEELKSLPVTAALIALFVAEWGARKEFTLESQQQGALNPHLLALLQVVKSREPDGLRLIAYMLPTEEIFREVDSHSPEIISDIHSRWTEWMGVFARFLDTQWKKGVGKSSRRDMRVLPSGSHVNSAGWNAVADAWDNGCRFLRLAASVCGIPGQPLYLKVLRLIANDQFQWAGAVGKTVNPTVGVFHDITAQGFLPWNAVLRPDRFDSARIVTALAESCTTRGCNLNGWLGLPKLRTEDKVRDHTDMICGCKVPAMSIECATFLTTLGIFGSNEWSGK